MPSCVYLREQTVVCISLGRFNNLSGLLKQVEEKEDRRGKTKQEDLVHMCPITWPLERDEALSYAS